MGVITLCTPPEAADPMDLNSASLLSTIISCEEKLEGNKMQILSSFPPDYYLSQIHFYYY